MTLKEKYGSLALVAGASKGIGASFSKLLAKNGFDLVLIARNKEDLNKQANALQSEFNVEVQTISCDLADHNATQHILESLNGKSIDILVYNAAQSHIGSFEENGLDNHLSITKTNIITPLSLVESLSKGMLKRKRGAIILMSSLAGFQGSGFLTTYAASKAFNRVFAESLWYEWKDRGVDVIACCAGATATQNYIDSNPGKSSLFAPKVQHPDEVAEECLKALGKKPSIITGFENRLASFFMQRVLPRKMAIKIMGDTTRKIYRI